MRLAKVTRDSHVDGPGRRTVVHFQGCSRECPGCANRNMWMTTGGTQVTPKELASTVLGDGSGITLSGGEPLEQPVEELSEFIRLLREGGVESIVLYTGYALSDEALKYIADKFEVDVIVDGPFLMGLSSCSGMRGSSNQRLHFVTKRHKPEEFCTRKAEIILGRDGSYSIRGFPDSKVTGVIECLEECKPASAADPTPATW